VTDPDLRKLRRLEPWFYLAPSAHNTQPWLLEYHADRIDLRFDPARHLTVGDPTRRDLFLSLGCFAEAVLIAAAAEGIPLAFRADDSSFVAAADVYETEFGLADLYRRQTSRLPYTGGAPVDEARAMVRPEERLHELEAASVRDLFVAADCHFYDSPALVEELRSWLRLGKRDARDGLSYECLALSRVEARALSVLLRRRVYPVVRALRAHRIFTASTARLLESGTVLVLTGPGDELLESGRSLMRVWLALARAGCATHPLSQILDYSETEAELARRLDLPAGTRLLSVFRAGRSAPAPRSHRLVSASPSETAPPSTSSPASAAL
jgi:hypothetical protein